MALFICGLLTSFKIVGSIEVIHIFGFLSMAILLDSCKSILTPAFLQLNSANQHHHQQLITKPKNSLSATNLQGGPLRSL